MAIDNPVQFGGPRPPHHRLPREVAVSLRASDDVALEALTTVTARAERSVVVCHPHPLFGGTMHNAVVVALVRGLGEHDGELVGTLRFNFRGVEGSAGEFDEGRAELLDVLAALDAVTELAPRARVSLVGYSFGAWVALRAAWQDRRVERVALVAPPARTLDFNARDKRALPVEIAVGDSDSFLPVPDARELARALGAQLHILEGADHSLVGKRRTAARVLTPFVAPELSL